MTGEGVSTGAGLRHVQAVMVDLVAYAQMMGYVNDIEPLDKQWVRSPATATA